MDDEKKVFSFSTDELNEAEELNARTDTRMTEEYKAFLREQFGEEEPGFDRSVEPGSRCEEAGSCCEEAAAGQAETDADEAGSYYEDGTAGAFDDGSISGRYEASESGSYSEDGSEPEGFYDEPDFEPKDIFCDDGSEIDPDSDHTVGGSYYAPAEDTDDGIMQL